MTNPPTPYNGRCWTRQEPVDVRTWTGRLTPALAAWIGDNLITVDEQQLTVHNADHDPVTLQPGWVLVRYPDGALIVHSPAAAARKLEPEAS
ncbi:hypothetical protein [Streptomyces sp. NPDC005799]|uniref:hypothetical protein n=1 Tax=Streptomyces sp. NPDC005799 TaxID=3154678 RepID=UPI0033DF0ED2